MLAYTALSVLSAPVYLHYLGVAQYGISVLLNTTIAPLGLLNMGMGQAAIKFMAEAHARHQPKEANGYLQATFVTTAALGGLGVIALILAAHLLTSRVFHISPAAQHEALLAVPWAALTWLLFQLRGQLISVPSALQRYSISSVGTTVSGAFSMGAGLVSLWMGGGLVTLMQVRCASVLFTAVVWFFIARHIMPELTLRPCLNRQAFSKCMNFGVWQMVGAVGGVASNQGDKALLGMYVSDIAVGLFAVPQTIVDTAYSLINRAADVLLPAVSEIDAAAGRGRSFEVALRAGWILSLIATMVMGCIAVMGNDLLRLYVGRSIEMASGRLLVIIALTAVASSGSVAINQFLLGIADTKMTAFLAIASGIVVVGFGILLIPRFGLQGAALSDVAAILLVRPCVQQVVWRRHGTAIPWAVFASYMYGPAVIGIPLSLALRAIRNAIPWESGWAGLALCSVLSCGVIVVGVLLFDRLLPGSAQRKADFGQILRYAWSIPRRAVRAAAFASR
jgi:O-antigen/teichoic acid export membrane protein